MLRVTRVQLIKHAWQIAATKPFASHFKLSKNSSMPAMSASDWTFTAAAEALHFSALHLLLLVVQGGYCSSATPLLQCGCSEVLHGHRRRDWLLQISAQVSCTGPKRR